MEKISAKPVIELPIITVRILISVYDKTNLAELIEALRKFSFTRKEQRGEIKEVEIIFEIISTGATYDYLAEYLAKPCIEHNSNNKEKAENKENNININDNNTENIISNINNISNVGRVSNNIGSIDKIDIDNKGNSSYKAIGTSSENNIGLHNISLQEGREINKDNNGVDNIGANIKLQQISEYIGFPEILGGRVKTLHPKIHGGILADRELHQEELLEHNISNIDLVVVNLYPFLEYVKNNKSETEIIENIDIGGVALLRAAAKNFKYVTVLSDPADYRDFSKNLNFLEFNSRVIQDEVGREGGLQYRKSLAKKAFDIVAQYDAAISYWFTTGSCPRAPNLKIDSLLKSGQALYVNDENLEQKLGTREIEKKIGQGALKGYSLNHSLSYEKTEALPEELLIKGKKQFLFRYGENPHQQAAFYSSAKGGLPFIQLQGKTLSYNNILDSEAALTLVQEFEQPAAVIIKHNNPCGVALGTDLFEAYTKALVVDPISAFGGIVAFNCIINKALAEELIKIFFEVIIAPGIEEEAKEILKNKVNLRVLIYSSINSNSNISNIDSDIDSPNNYNCDNYNNGNIINNTINNTNANNNRLGAFNIINCKNLKIRSAFNGFLVQQEDKELFEELQTVTKQAPSIEELEQLKFAWKVSKYVRSNAIVVAKDFQTLGIGAGQMNRVSSVNIALQQAAKSLTFSNNFHSSDEEKPSLVLASDAFFPFPDSIELAAKSNITAIIQPGGSIKDKAVIEAANYYNIAMVFTKMRHFLH